MTETIMVNINKKPGAAAGVNAGGDPPAANATADNGSGPAGGAPAATAKTSNQAPAKEDQRKFAVYLVGPPRRFSFRGKVFEEGTARRVTRAERDHLMGTGYFKEVAKPEEVPENGIKVARLKKKYRVGDFKEKNDAMAYAWEVHGVSLDQTLSLRQLNQYTVDLARVAMRARAGAGQPADKDVDEEIVEIDTATDRVA